MCNVHFIFPITGKIIDSDIVLMNKLLENASEINKDAYGVSDGKTTITFKGVYDDNEAKAFNCFVGSSFLIGHNRIATQGLTQQPIIYKGVALSHNGIITSCNSIKAADKSDSLLWLENFVNGLEKNKNAVFENELKNVLSETYGSYSMALAYKDKLYYAKNASTIFFLFLIEMKDGRTIIVGDTNSENVSWALSERKFGFRIPFVFGKVISSITTESNKLYTFEKNEGKVYLGEIKEPVFKKQEWLAEEHYTFNGNNFPDSDNTTIEYYGDLFNKTPIEYYPRG